MSDRLRPPETESENARLSRLIAEAAEPLPDPDDPAFGRFFDRFAEAQVVLLGRPVTAPPNSTGRGRRSRGG